MYDTLVKIACFMGEWCDTLKQSQVLQVVELGDKFMQDFDKVTSVASFLDGDEPSVFQ